jgi:hypothetical protein
VAQAEQFAERLKSLSFRGAQRGEESLVSWNKPKGDSTLRSGWEMGVLFPQAVKPAPLKPKSQFEPLLHGANKDHAPIFPDFGRNAGWLANGRAHVSSLI